MDVVVFFMRWLEGKSKFSCCRLRLFFATHNSDKEKDFSLFSIRSEHWSEITLHLMDLSARRDIFHAKQLFEDI